MENRIPGIIKKEFNANTLEIKRINEGFSHYMYDVKINKAPFDIIVRFSNNTQKGSNLGKEKYVIDLLKSNGLPVPKIYAFHHPKEKKEEGYIVMEKFKGIRLDTIWDSLSKDERIQITKEMGKILAKMHLISLNDFGNIEEDGNIKGDEPFKFRKTGESLQFNRFARTWLKHNLEDIARLASYPHISKKFISDLLSYLIQNLDVIKYDGRPKFIHCDFMPGHIFVEKKDVRYVITGIIDFEFAQSYSPDYDFIKLHRAGFFDDHEIKQALIDAYGPVNEKAIEIHRLTRDVGFAWAVLEAGNKELCDKVLKKVEETLRKNTTS